MTLHWMHISKRGPNGHPGQGAASGHRSASRLDRIRLAAWRFARTALAVTASVAGACTPFLLPHAALAASIAACPVAHINGEANWPPYSYRDHGALNGVVVSVAQTALNSVGVAVHHQHTLPSKRLMLSLANGQSDIIAGAVKTEDTERAFKLSAPISQEAIHIFVHRDNLEHIHSIHDLPDYVGIRPLGLDLPHALQIQNGVKLRIPEHSFSDGAYYQLAKNMVDYIIGFDHKTQRTIHQLKLETVLHRVEPAVTHTSIHLAFAPNSACSRHLPAINKVIKAMHDSGKIQELKNAYLQSF